MFDLRTLAKLNAAFEATLKGGKQRNKLRGKRATAGKFPLHASITLTSRRSSHN